MAVEQVAAEVHVHTRLQKQSRPAVYTENLSRKIHPLPEIDSSNHSQHVDRISAVNTMLSGTYGLTVAYDELCRRALGKAKRDMQGKISTDHPAAYTLSDFRNDIDVIEEFSSDISQLASAFLQNEDTQAFQEIVREKTEGIMDQIFERNRPPKHTHPVDTHLGLDRFLQSEVLSVHIHDHDVRNALTVFKGKTQLLQNRKEEEINDDLKASVRLKEHVGEQIRKKLHSPFPMHKHTPIEIARTLEEFTQSESFVSQSQGWRFHFPEEISPDLPNVVFNELMLHSIFENIFLNSQKSRTLLEEHFGTALFSLLLIDTDTQFQRRGREYLSRFQDRMQEDPTIAVDFASVLLRRRQYLEIIFRDNGIGNDYRNARRQWKRNFSVGNSDWSSSRNISGTGIAMGAHRNKIQELFPHSHADMFLRNRTDDKHGAELVIRLPEER